MEENENNNPKPFDYYYCIVGRRRKTIPGIDTVYTLFIPCTSTRNKGGKGHCIRAGSRSSGFQSGTQLSAYVTRRDYLFVPCVFFLHHADGRVYYLPLPLNIHFSNEEDARLWKNCGAEAQRRTEAGKSGLSGEITTRMRTIQFHPRGAGGASAVEQEHVRRGTAPFFSSRNTRTHTHTHTPSNSTQVTSSQLEPGTTVENFFTSIPPLQRNTFTEYVIHIYLSKHKRNTLLVAILRSTNSLSLSLFPFSSPLRLYQRWEKKENSPSLLGSNTTHGGVSARRFGVDRWGFAHYKYTEAPHRGSRARGGEELARRLEASNKRGRFPNGLADGRWVGGGGGGRGHYGRDT